MFSRSIGRLIARDTSRSLCTWVAIALTAVCIASPSFTQSAENQNVAPTLTGVERGVGQAWVSHAQLPENLSPWGMFLNATWW